MPRIFDNIELPLLKTLKETLQSAVKADFCVGYFNLRGWGQIDRDIEQLPESCCRATNYMTTSTNYLSNFIIT